MSAKAPAEAEKAWVERSEDPALEEGGLKGVTDAPAGDAVFGEATEDGPNYRSVRVLNIPVL